MTVPPHSKVHESRRRRVWPGAAPSRRLGGMFICALYSKGFRERFWGCLGLGFLERLLKEV